MTELMEQIGLLVQLPGAGPAVRDDDLIRVVAPGGAAAVINPELVDDQITTAKKRLAVLLSAQQLLEREAAEDALVDDATAAYAYALCEVEFDRMPEPVQVSVRAAMRTALEQVGAIGNRDD